MTKENSLLLFHAPGRTKEFNPFVLHRTFYGAYDEVVSVDWSSDSRFEVFIISSGNHSKLDDRMKYDHNAQLK